MVRFGTECPDGFLPVYSVGSEEEARRLLTLACPTDRITGEYIAKELAASQTLANLETFSNRLADLHDEKLLGTEHCDCVLDAPRKLPRKKK